MGENNPFEFDDETLGQRVEIEKLVSKQWA
jgi:hypothetical protein